MRLKIFVILHISCLLFAVGAQEKTKVTPEEIFYQFTEAYFEHDLAQLKALTFYNDELESLLQMPKFTGKELIALKKKLRQTPIDWHGVGEVIKINNAPIRINEIMANERKKIGTIHLLEMVYPIILRKTRATNEWKVDPTFVIQSIKKHIKIQMKKNQRDYRIIFDDKTYHLNEGEKIIIEDLKGISHRVVLFRNEIQHYRDGRVRFHYHKDMEVFPNKMKGGHVYTLNSELGPEVHLIVYDQGVTLQEAEKKYINVWIENYEVNDGQFEKERFKNVRQEINGKLVDGKVMYVRQAGKVFYNQFYFFQEEGRVLGVFAKCRNIDTGLLNKYLKVATEELLPLTQGAKK
jgi:hypothetical protein